MPFKHILPAKAFDPLRFDKYFFYRYLFMAAPPLNLFLSASARDFAEPVSFTNFSREKNYFFLF